MSQSRNKHDSYKSKFNANRTPINFIRYESVSLSNGNCLGLSVNYEKDLACVFFDNNEILVLCFSGVVTCSCLIIHSR